MLGLSVRSTTQMLFIFSVYLDGLECFEVPTEAAQSCMRDMTVGITSLATKKVTQKMPMNAFFVDFCS